MPKIVFYNVKKIVLKMPKCVYEMDPSYPLNALLEPDTKFGIRKRHIGQVLPKKLILGDKTLDNLIKSASE